MKINEKSHIHFEISIIWIRDPIYTIYHIILWHFISLNISVTKPLQKISPEFLS